MFRESILFELRASSDIFALNFSHVLPVSSGVGDGGVVSVEREVGEGHFVKLLNAVKLVPPFSGIHTHTTIFEMIRPPSNHIL